MAKGVTVDLIVDPKKAIEGLDAASEKSSGVANVLKGLGGAAAAGIAALGLAAAGAVAGLTAATKSAGEYAENVQLAASKTHLTTQAIQEMQYASKITGVEFETISGSLTKLTRSIGQAQQGTATQVEAFAALGVSTTDASGNLRDSTAVFEDVLAALGRMDNPTQRDVYAMQLLGRSATELNPLIDGSAGSLSELAAQARNAGAVLSDEMLTKLAAADDAFDGLSAGVDAAKNALGLTLMPILTALGTQGTGLLGQFTTALLDADGDLSQAAPAIGAVVTSAVGVLLNFIPQILDVGTSIIGALLTGIVTSGPDLIKSAVPILLGFVGTLVKQLPALVDAGLKILVALGEGIADALPTLIPAAVDALIGIVGAIVDNLPMLLDAGLQIITGLATGLYAAYPVLIDALPELILGIVDFLIGAIPQLIETGVALLSAMVTALPEIITAITDALPQIITGIVTALVAAQPQLIMAGIELFVALVAALPQIIISLVGAVPQIIQGLVKAFTSPSTLSQLAGAGRQLLEGLWQGIKGAGDWLWRQLSSFFGGILKNIRNLLGIHSPSTVFAGIGDNLVLGLEKGLSGPNNLTGIMRGLSAQVQGGFDARLSASAIGGGSAQAGAVVAPAIYVQNPWTGEYMLAQQARVADARIRQNELNVALDFGAGGLA
jgi:hypothetical protein